MTEQRTRATEIVRIVAPILILLVAIGGFVALAALREKPAGAAAAEDIFAVETATVEPYHQRLTLDVSGMAAPFREIPLSAEVAGKIVFKAPQCRAGNFVQQGMLLLEIDPSDYELEEDRLEEELAQAEISLTELDKEIEGAQQLLTLAGDDVALQQRELNRVQKLSRIMSETELDQAKRAHLAARNSEQTFRNQINVFSVRRRRLESARQLVDSQLKKARLDVQRTKITAPVDGVIVSEDVEQGQFVQRGTALLRLEDTSAIEVKCSLQMRELYWLWRQNRGNVETLADSRAGGAYEVPPASATVIYRLAGQDFAWSGKLARFDGIGLDEKTRSVPCRIVVSTPRDVNLLGADGTLTPTTAGPPALVRGMYVSVRIHTPAAADLVRIPEAAVRPGSLVWLLREGRLQRREVEISQRAETGVILHAGASQLAVGDKVVLSPLAVPYDGMAAREATR